MRNEYEYCGRLAGVLADDRVRPDAPADYFIRLGPRFLREWRYFPYEWAAEDTLSGILENLR